MNTVLRLQKDKIFKLESNSSQLKIDQLDKLACSVKDMNTKLDSKVNYVEHKISLVRQELVENLCKALKRVECLEKRIDILEFRVTMSTDNTIRSDIEIPDFEGAPLEVHLALSLNYWRKLDDGASV